MSWKTYFGAAGTLLELWPRETKRLSQREGPGGYEQGLRAYSEHLQELLKVPGAARDMHDLALEKDRHDMEMDRQHVKAFRRAQWLTFFLALFLIVCGTAIILAGYAWAGTTIITADLVGLVLAFLYGRRSRSDRSEAD